MKTVNVIIKVIAALAAIAGVVYVVATYGDKIVVWAKKLLGCCGECCCEDVVEEASADEAEVTEEVEAVEEIVADEADLTDEVPAADPETVVASESDFEG